MYDRNDQRWLVKNEQATASASDSDLEGGAHPQGRRCTRRGKNQASYFSRVSICDGSSLNTTCLSTTSVSASSRWYRGRTAMAGGLPVDTRTFYSEITLHKRNVPALISSRHSRPGTHARSDCRESTFQL